MHFKISHKGKKKNGGQQLMIFIKEIYGRLMLSGIYFMQHNWFCCRYLMVTIIYLDRMHL